MIQLRWGLLGGEALAMAVAEWGLEISLPLLPLLAVLLLNGVANLLYARRVGEASLTELFGQYCFDIASLSALLFFSGGATNPFVSLLLPPVAMAALSLPLRPAMAIAALACAAYSLLMVVFVPLAVADATRATRLHLAGMWLTFIVSAVMLLWLIARMTSAIRHRDAQLAAAREQGLRDERILALAAQAAGAAHELGTPLATMAVIAGDLEHDARLGVEAQADLALMKTQIAACKRIIHQLAERAGAERWEEAKPTPVDVWAQGVIDRWMSLRPRPGARLTVAGGLDGAPAPSLVAEPALDQGLVGLLDNAAKVGADQIVVNVSWSAVSVRIDVLDNGPGFPADVLEIGGREPLTHRRTKEIAGEAPNPATGSGLGLFLADTAVRRHGGRLALSNRPQGGGCASLELPVAP
ncbi:MAG: HAMP domain-containing histidine kinase [Rhodocyclaceae bacterium]|nr:HAMP domain-containing histidine kinase [Rhodocyclaceae bacterium]